MGQCLGVLQKMTQIEAGISDKIDFGPTIYAPNTITVWGRYKRLTKATLRSAIIVSNGMITRC